MFQTIIQSTLDLSLSQFIGLVGFFTYLGSFFSLQMGWLDGNGNRYALLNIAAAACVLFSLLETFNLASALIQISWIAIGLGGLALRALGQSGDTKS